MKKLALASLVLISSSSFAAHYRSGGCGLGSMIFSEPSKASQILASTTNGSTYTQLFGISSGTSNCTDEHHRTSLLPFIKTNKIQLENDAAKGAGESLTGLSSLMGCKDSLALNRNLQQNFETVFLADQSAQQLTDKILHSVQSNVDLRKTCQMFM